jgi:hypothetical protein
MSGTNRPFKYGARDRKEFIVENTEVSLKAINDTSGNPVFLGRAKIDVVSSEDKWQIRKITYDSNQGVTDVDWPEDIEGISSSDYSFTWSTVSLLTITAITKANPAVVTVSSAGDISDGDLIVIQDLIGITELNFNGSNIYTVAGLAGTSFQLAGIDSSSFEEYFSGGSVNYGEVINYTYS